MVHCTHILAKSVLNLADGSDVEVKVNRSVHYLGKHGAEKFAAGLHLHVGVQLGFYSKQNC